MSWNQAFRSRTRRSAASRGQRGMTLVETMLALFMSSLMMLPMMGWATLALKEQASIEQRNVSGTSLGLLRTYYVRDVSNSLAAATEGDALTECVSGVKGERVLMVLSRETVRIAYSVIPDGTGGASLQRQLCDHAGAAASLTTELLTDVIEGGTSASCNTTSDLAAAALAAGIDTGSKKSKAAEDTDASCRRVSLQVTTSNFAQAALTATVRSGGVSDGEAAQPPVVVASATPTSGPRRLSVQFDSKGSADPGGDALTYLWDFGDGTQSTDANPTHGYVLVGTFSATLTVTTVAGLSAAASVNIAVADNVPVAVIASPATATTTYRGAPVPFSSLGSNDDLDAPYGGKIVGYAWDFGDATTSTDANPTKSYDAISPAGGYTVRLVVTDDAGTTASAEIKVVVANRTPSVMIAASTTSGVTPLAVDFSSIVVDETTMSPSPALTYAWDFGDGTTSTAADPAPKTYTGAASRTVSLTVTDDIGATASATTTITVNVPLLVAPTGLKKVSSGTTSGKRYVNLSWKSVTGASQYEVFLQCVSASCTDTYSATAVGTTVKVSGLQNKSLSYDVQVRTLNSTGQWGSWSSKVRISV